MNLDFIIAVFQYSSPLLLAVLAWLKYSDKRSYKRLITARSSWPTYLREHQGVEVTILKTLQSTGYDRFIILEMVEYDNQKKPDTVSSVYQIRTEDQCERDYFEVRIDGDYKKKVSDVVHAGILSFDTSKMQESLIKNIYLDEGVKHAIWGHINTYRDELNGETKTVFFSFANHQDHPVEPKEMAQASSLQGKLTGLKNIYYTK